MGWLVLLLLILAIVFGFWTFAAAAVLAIRVLFWVFVVLLVLSLLGWGAGWRRGTRVGPPI
jgi:uncharacterized membrane protein YtjA (UPF0391 family)